MSRTIAFPWLVALVACREPIPRSELARPVDGGATPAQPVGRAMPDYVTRLLPKAAGAPTAASLQNLSRLPDLTERHRTLLDAHGFFIAPQAPPKPAKGDGRVAARAKHLFQVYERNDYIRFPSYVTVDLAIDLTHQYFDVVLRKLEREHLVPKLREALQGFVDASLAERKRARTPEGKRAAGDAAVYWATALHLLEVRANDDRPDEVTAQPLYDFEREGMAPPPKPVAAKPSRRLPGALEAEVVAHAAKVRAAAATETFAAFGLQLDLTQMKPRSHYADDGVLQRYFRAMSWLGMSSFAIEGEAARPAVLTMLVRSYAAAGPAAARLDEVLAVTNFIVGAPPTAGLRRAAEVMAQAIPGHASDGIDALLAPTVQAAIVSAWSKLPVHPIAADRGPVVEPLGKRVFVDTLAMSAMLPIVRDLPPTADAQVRTMMGAAGAAAAIGDDAARKIVMASGDAATIGAALDAGRGALGPLERNDDAYHRTLLALRSVLATDAGQFDPQAWRLRTLQSFAGGWAMLRHDTLLYAYQMGAECDAMEQPAPHGWVEPVPEVYRRLRAMIEGFAAQYAAAGIHEAAPVEGDYSQFHTVAEKTAAMVGFLKQLEAWSAQELAGKPFTPEDRTAIATVGGFAEHVLLTFADAYELGEGNDDMAVVADVFTWRDQALEVAVGHPELIYAAIPTREGWMLARGAVLGYRELLVPANERMTDQQWRARLAEAPDLLVRHRPAWLAPIAAPSVGMLELPASLDAQERCEYFGGAFEL